MNPADENRATHPAAEAAIASRRVELDHIEDMSSPLTKLVRLLGLKQQQHLFRTSSKSLLDEGVPDTFV